MHIKIIFINVKCLKWDFLHSKDLNWHFEFDNDFRGCKVFFI